MVSKKTEFVIGLLFVSGLCFVTYKLINRKKKELTKDDDINEDSDNSTDDSKLITTPNKNHKSNSVLPKKQSNTNTTTKKPKTSSSSSSDVNPNKKKAIKINGVLIYVSDDNKGHLVFEGGGRIANFKLNAKVKKLGVTLWRGVVSVARISKLSDGGIRITDNTGKSFDGEDTDLIPLVNQFKKGNNKLIASIGSADINLERTA